MSDVLMGIMLAYLCGVALQVGFGLIFIADSRNSDSNERQKQGARLILASPIWPALIVLLGVRGMASLIRMAEFERKKP